MYAGAASAYGVPPASAAVGGYGTGVMMQAQPPQQQDVPGVHSQPVADDEQLLQAI